MGRRRLVTLWSFGAVSYDDAAMEGYTELGTPTPWLGAQFWKKDNSNEVRVVREKDLSMKDLMENHDAHWARKKGKEIQLCIADDQVTEKSKDVTGSYVAKRVWTDVEKLTKND